MTTRSQLDEALKRVRTSHTLPSVRRAPPPFAAGTLEAFTMGSATAPVFIFDVQVRNPAEMSATRVAAPAGVDRVRLDWRTKTPAALAVVTLRARNTVAASERVVTVPVPTAARGDTS